MFIDSTQFPFTSKLENKFRVVQKELAQLPQELFGAWPEKYLYDNRWDVFGLYAYNKKLKRNCSLCPETTALVEQIPGMMTAGFSRLAPNTHIRPHVGYHNSVLRCHLGLVVAPECTLRVGLEMRAWQEGKCLVFDDTTEHEAWNKSDMPRTVLLVDFAKGGPRPGNVCSQEVKEALEAYMSGQ